MLQFCDKKMIIINRIKCSLLLPFHFETLQSRSRELLVHKKFEVSHTVSSGESGSPEAGNAGAGRTKPTQSCCPCITQITYIFSTIFQVLWCLTLFYRGTSARQHTDTLVLKVFSFYFWIKCEPRSGENESRNDERENGAHGASVAERRKETSGTRVDHLHGEICKIINAFCELTDQR